MNKPQVFSLLDFFTFGMLTVIAIVADVATWMSAVPFEAKALMTTVCLAFAAIYVILLVMRAKTISSCAFFTECGWGVRNNSKTYITKEEVDNEISWVKELWRAAIDWEDKIDDVLNLPFMIVFEDGIGTAEDTGVKIGGTVIARRFSAFEGQIIIYRMDTVTLPVSALKHEVGHLIYFGKFGILDNPVTHKFMAEHNLP